MDMCYEGTLVMPSSYAVMNEEEMTYVEGGDVNLFYNSSLRSKGGCFVTATAVRIATGYKNISVYDIAAEIFAHTFVFYNFGLALRIGKMLGIGGLIEKLHDRVMNGIGIDNKLDDREEGGIKYYQGYRLLYNYAPAVI